MKYIKKLIRNSKRALNQQVIKKKQEIVKYAPRLTGIQGKKRDRLSGGPSKFCAVSKPNLLFPSVLSGD